MYVQPLQVILVIPKSIESLLFFLNLILLNNKYSEIPWKERPQFHKLLMIGMLSWFIYITLDIFIYVFASFSFETAPEGTYYGYDSQYPSLYIVNILRDFGLAGGLMICWMYLIASFNLNLGEDRSKEIFWNSRVIPIIIILISAIIVIADNISVTVGPTGPSVSAVWDGFAGFSLALTIAIYLISAVMLGKKMRSLSDSDSSKTFRRRILYTTIGFLMMGFGHIYWIVLALTMKEFPQFFMDFNFNIVLAFIGHFIWASSPIFLYFGLARKSDSK